MTYVMTKPCPICAQQLIKQKPTDTVPCLSRNVAKKSGEVVG